jgi:hypothetical protein
MTERSGYYEEILVFVDGKVWELGERAKTIKELKEKRERINRESRIVSLTTPYTLITKGNPYIFIPVEERKVVATSKGLENLKGKKVKTAIKYIREHVDPKKLDEFYEYVMERYEKEYKNKRN